MQQSSNNPQKPRRGWIYMIDPQQVSLRCRKGHRQLYSLPSGNEVDCQHPSCQLKINSSHVLRGCHPHILVSNDDLLDTLQIPQIVAVIPCSSSERNKGLPTTYPINPSSRNGLSTKTFALTHQVTTIDINCLKDSNHHWLTRVGVLPSKELKAIEERLQYALGIEEEGPSEDWFRKNATPDLVKKIVGFLPKEEQEEVIEELIDLT